MQAEILYSTESTPDGYNRPMDRARRTIMAAVKSGAASYKSLSELIGKSHSYIQQFIERGTPRRLDEIARRKIAAHLAVDESQLLDEDDPALSATVPRANEHKKIIADAERATGDLPQAVSSALKDNGEAWLITSDGLEAVNIMPGDYVIIGDRKPRPGDLVLALLRNGKRDIPILRVFTPPVLLSGSFSPAAPIRLDQSVVIAGVVSASVRVR